MKKVKCILIFLLLSLSTSLFADFIENLDSLDTSMFHTADGWTNGWPFDCTWRSECVTFSNGIMTLTLDSESGDPPYKAGEYRTNDNYSYGYFEVRMKASNKEGTVSSFFTYTGPSEGNPWDEVDIEILGKDPTKMQTNYFTNGVGHHETTIELGFDASEDFHVYGFEWRADYIKWYVDGQLVLTEDGSRGALPSTPSKIMMNFWPGTGVDGWLGPFDGETPQTVEYDWFRYSAGGPDTGVTKGDVNEDGLVDIVDALQTARFSAGFNISGFNQEAGDVNGDGIVSIVDALLIARYSAGLIDGF